MPRHWIDELADKLYESLKKRGKSIIVFNSGLSVSGLQHVGRLRGEIIIPEVLRKLLQSRGLVVKQYLTLYTQDSWKAKEAQVKRFKENGVKYAGWPLIRVPDPEGCHSNWVEHYWKDFGPFIGEFTDGEIEVVTTTELYKNKLKEFTKLVFENREKVRMVINKYRGRKQYKEGWIPFEPICEKCGRIDTTSSTRIVDEEHVEYVCSGCGHRGVSSIENGKLMWRIEWVGVWWSLGVDFEAYGKDHAMPGGSRDSCVDLAVNVFNMQPPEGIPYEWVEWKTPDGKLADMGSSDFLGFTPREWLEVAHPHVFRFIVLKTPPMKKFAVGLHEVPHYYNIYYKAERIYYGVEKAVSEEEEVLLSRSYELSYPRGLPPREMPEQVPYLHLAILAQIIPCEKWATEGLTRLKTSGHISEKPTEYGLKRILEIMQKAHVWVEKYGPSDMRVKLLPISEAEKVASTIPSSIADIFKELYERFQTLDLWSEEKIKDAFIAVTSRLGEDLVKSFYTYFYRLLSGKDSGPRAAPLLALLGRELSLKYILLATKTHI
ncbi:MAG: lysine--tRNA ligase [Desulfurococcaceae archaeon]|nr:lysine--tRNA ligase [Desulfurococcaceae archaeon]